MDKGKRRGRVMRYQILEVRMRDLLIVGKERIHVRKVPWSLRDNGTRAVSQRQLSELSC